jgi:hypothetical protein
MRRVIPGQDFGLFGTIFIIQDNLNGQGGVTIAANSLDEQAD